MLVVVYILFDFVNFKPEEIYICFYIFQWWTLTDDTTQFLSVLFFCKTKILFSLQKKYKQKKPTRQHWNMGSHTIHVKQRQIHTRKKVQQMQTFGNAKSKLNQK